MVAAASTALAGPQAKDAEPGDWMCPMDPDVRSNKPGVCPRCGMKLLLHVPDRIEFVMRVSHSPELLRPGDTAALTFRILDPVTDLPVQHFEIVHEKLMHLFLISQNLEFFAHVHPELQPDSTFRLPVQLPLAGMYRMLADYYPSGSVPQLSLETLFVTGASQQPLLAPSLAPCSSVNLRASLRTDPEVPLAGLETKLFFALDPPDGLEPYLGAWGHMLAASEDLIDLLHLHPFLSNGGSSVQFNAIFPRSGLYKIWTQFQRKGEVNTVVFTVPVKSL
jgi:Heavy metal binding domain